MELDKRGYQVMTHALRGDSAHMVLETYEEVEKSNGPRDRRFRLEHGQIFPTEDLPRFAKLSVIVSTQPSGCCSDIGSNFDPQDKTPTDRWRSLEHTGATLAFGSDWPCTWPPDPFVGIQQVVRPDNLALSGIQCNCGRRIRWSGPERGRCHQLCVRAR